MIKTEWDYTHLAKAYRNRAPYADGALDLMLSKTGIAPGARFCDVGAGTGHLTVMLARRGYGVIAVEPNDAMRQYGQEASEGLANVNWQEGTGEQTGQPDQNFQMVTFGSSFNVVDREKALAETRRIAVPQGWFACMWNHRDLKDPIQVGIEDIIKSKVEAYNYGRRRNDQGPFLEASGYFHSVEKLEGRISHNQTIEDCVTAWRSHATLARQAGDGFSAIIGEIEAYLRNLGTPQIAVPYTTVIWVARLKDQ